MPLKSLELSGYKTFANKTTFEFAKTITAIVGPNGAGKSNIADALRWVLGEQSFSQLRGRKTVDMIFSGSERRSRAGMAYASVVFDNTDGWLPTDYSEVAITRRAYGDGQNEYLINNQMMRLRDVSHLLGRSGLAERTYTIIGQGLVDIALSLKAEERRKLFEEAAGIGLYRSRREEALRRLDTTRRNLERVRDILEELKPHLRSLERRARLAQNHEQVKADLQGSLQQWYGYHWHRARRELKSAQDFTGQKKSNLNKARQEQAALNQQMATLRERIHGLRAQLSTWRREMAQLQNRREAANRNLAVLGERLRAYEERFATLKTESVKLEEARKRDQGRLKQIGQESERLQMQADEARKRVQAALKGLEARQEDRQGTDQAIQDTTRMLYGLDTRRIERAARLEELKARAAQLKTTLARTNQNLAEAEQVFKVVSVRLEKADEILRQVNAGHQLAKVNLLAHESKLEKMTNALNGIRKSRAARQAEVTRIQAQIDLLEQSDGFLADYATGARLLLEAARQERLSGVRSTLNNVLEVDEKFETAIAAALGEYLQAVLLEASVDLTRALNLLDDASTRAALLPLERLTAAPAIEPPADPACLGLAADLVRVSPDLRPVVDLLLGWVWVVQDRETAIRVLHGHHDGVRAVTLQGEVFRADGPILAGQAGKSEPLSRLRQQRERADALQVAYRKVGEFDDHLRQLEAQLAHLQAEADNYKTVLQATQMREDEASKVHHTALSALEEARRQRDWQIKQRDSLKLEIVRTVEIIRQSDAEKAHLQARITQARQALQTHREKLAGQSLEEQQAQVSHWEMQVALSEHAAADSASRQDELLRAVDLSQQRVAAQKSKMIHLGTEMELIKVERTRLRQREGQIGNQIAALLAQFEPSEAVLETSARDQEAIQAAEHEARQTLTDAERTHAESQIALARQQESLENLYRQIEDDFDLTVSEPAEEASETSPPSVMRFLEALPNVDEISPERTENIKRQRAQLRRMGAITPEAQKEYQEVKSRFEFLDTQLRDLEEAEADIQEVITELNVCIEREFRETFDAVARQFRAIFTRLFDGGSARIHLTEPEDLTNAGVEIEARLPGHRARELSLLSGGERSLTATALIFALLKVSPTPFCVLDEVDAMLDDANIARFTDLLHELSQKTQFILITHNVNTIQAAEIIYGITMDRDSTSQVLSLKLDEVAEVV